MNVNQFKKTIWNYYIAHGRHDLPWRKTRDSYKILVSEIMLQQTQVSRVITKYKSFLKKFPTAKTLADASLKDVLLEWQGLGYNRRAKYLKLCTEKVMNEYNGKFPLRHIRSVSGRASASVKADAVAKDLKILMSLPGIGRATAGDILAFAYNIPVPLIETNIRSVYIHFFPASPRLRRASPLISDKELLPLIEKTLDMKNPREWYWALFDYGAHLKNSKIKNPNHKSTHYVKQSPFKGSNREKRSQILKLILEKSRTEKEIIKTLGYEHEVVQENLKQMLKEHLIKKVNARFFI